MAATNAGTPIIIGQRISDAMSKMRLAVIECNECILAATARPKAPSAAETATCSAIVRGWL